MKKKNISLETNGDDNPESAVPIFQIVLPPNDVNDVPVKGLKKTTAPPANDPKICFKTVVVEDFINSESESDVDDCLEHLCALCDFKGNSELQLIKHNKNFHKIERPKSFKQVYMCDECSFYSKTTAEMEVHKTSHQSLNAFHCDRCRFVTDREEDLQIHSQIHTQNKPSHISCPLCSNTFKKMIEFMNHRKSHLVVQPTGQNRYKCSQCSYSNVNLRHAWNHVVNHLQVQKCIFCDFVTGKAADLKRHITSRHPNINRYYTSYESADISPSYFDIPSEDKEQFTGFDTSCVKEEVVDVVETNEVHQVNYFEDNISEVSEEDCIVSKKNNKTITQTKSKKMKIKNNSSEVTENNQDSSDSFLGFLFEEDSPSEPFCGFLFEEDSSSEPFLGFSSNSIKKLSTQKPLVQCPECNFSTKSKTGMKIHLLCHEPDEKKTVIKNLKQANKYICGECGFETISKINFKVHELSHEEPKFQYKCSECSFTHTSKKIFNNHLKIHLSKNYIKFPCLFCNKAFKSFMDLKLHKHKSHLPKDPKDKNKFICEKCDKTFLDKHILWNHMRLHFEKRSNIQCQECDYASINLYQIKRHYISNHSKQKLKAFLITYRQEPSKYVKTDATTCSKTKTKKSSIIMKKVSKPLRQSKREVLPKKLLLSCMKCDFETDDKVMFKDHNELHKKIKNVSYQCKKCNINIGDKDLFKAHKEIHKNEKPISYKCSNCDYETKDTTMLEVHTLGHEEINLLAKCSQCDFATNTETSMRNHYKCHLSKDEILAYACIFCNEVFRFSPQLTKHKDENHVRFVNSEKTIFQCPTCERKSHEKSKIFAHLKHHYRDRFRMNCTECPYTSMKLHDIKRHYIAMHNKEKLISFLVKYKGEQYQKNFLVLPNLCPKKENQIFQCDLCPYKTPRLSHLKFHQDVHSTKTYSCPYCNFVSRSRGSIRVHRNNHAPVKRFQCTECDYQTNLSTYFTKHRMKHQGIKIYSCDHCPYSTNFKECVIRHQIVHAEKPASYFCKECDYKTKYKNSLELHMLDHRT